LYATVPPVAPSVEPDKLVQIARRAGVPAAVHESSAEAVAAALADCEKGEVVLVAGSLFLVGEVRDFLMNMERTR
jgi:dihydrofolate synthase/folylpolyglutamate synthase